MEKAFLFQQTDSVFLQKKTLLHEVTVPVKTDSSEQHKNSFIESQRQFSSPAGEKKKTIKKQIIRNTVNKTDSLSKKKEDVTAGKDSFSIVVPASDSLIDTSFKFKDIITGNNLLPPTEITTSQTKFINLFQQHELLPSGQLHPLALNRSNGNWEFFILLFIVLSFTWVKVFYSKTVSQIIKAPFSNTLLGQVVRDENILLQKASVLLTVIFNITLAFFIYKLSVLYEWELEEYFSIGFGRFLFFALGISFLYSFKFFAYRITGFVFNTNKPMITYIFVIFLLNNILGIVLLPLIIALSFAPVFILNHIVIIALCIIALTFSYRIFKGITTGISFSPSSPFYLLIYLASLEIFPLLILAKIAVKNI